MNEAVLSICLFRFSVDRTEWERQSSSASSPQMIISHLLYTLPFPNEDIWFNDENKHLGRGE